MLMNLVLIKKKTCIEDNCNDPFFVVVTIGFANVYIDDKK